VSLRTEYRGTTNRCGSQAEKDLGKLPAIHARVLPSIARTQDLPTSSTARTGLGAGTRACKAGQVLAIRRKTTLNLLRLIPYGPNARIRDFMRVSKLHFQVKYLAHSPID